MTDVFISYKREERDQCERVAQKLRALDLDVWFDARLTAGDSFTAEIERELRKAKSVLVLWSPGSVTSRWVRNEAGIGLERKVLAAAQLSPCDMPVEFRDIHYDPLHEPNFADDHPGWLKLLERIGKLVGRPTLADYSRALGAAGKSLRGWADANPLDPLAKKARQVADQVGQVGLTANARAPTAAVRGSGALPAVIASLVVGAASAGGVWFLKPSGAPGMGLDMGSSTDPLAAALPLIGDWRPPGDATGCNPEQRLTIVISQQGLQIDDRVEPVRGATADGWVETGTGSSSVQYRRDGDRLFLRSAGSTDALEFVKC